MFTPWAEVHDDDIQYTHYYDKVFDEHAPTPFWDKLLTTQFHDKPEDEKQSPTKSKFKQKILFEMLVGRLLFPLKKHDSWGIVCFLVMVVLANPH